MAIDDTADLMQFLQPFPDATKEIALWLRRLVWERFPESNELIYDNYNALAFGWGLSDKLGDVFCSVAVYTSVNLGFNRGSELRDPGRLLTGKGSLYRYIKVKSIHSFPLEPIERLLYEAHAHALLRFGDKPASLTGYSIVKSVSVKKRRPA